MIIFFKMLILKKRLSSLNLNFSSILKSIFECNTIFCIYFYPRKKVDAPFNDRTCMRGTTNNQNKVRTQLWDTLYLSCIIPMATTRTICVGEANTSLKTAGLTTSSLTCTTTPLPPPCTRLPRTSNVQKIMLEDTDAGSHL